MKTQREKLEISGHMCNEKKKSICLKLTLHNIQMIQSQTWQRFEYLVRHKYCFYSTRLHLPVFAIHLQTNDRANEHATVNILITVSFCVPPFAIPLRVVSQIQLFDVL